MLPSLSHIIFIIYRWAPPACCIGLVSLTGELWTHTRRSDNSNGRQRTRPRLYIVFCHFALDLLMHRSSPVSLSPVVDLDEHVPLATTVFQKAMMSWIFSSCYSFRNHSNLLIQCSRNMSYYTRWKHCVNIFVETMQHFFFFSSRFLDEQKVQRNSIYLKYKSL